MRAFLIQHVDALITTALGLWITIYSLRHRERLRASHKKLVRALPILAPLMVAFGLLRFALDSHPGYVWQRGFTSDQRASAEFPCATTTETAIDSAQGVSVRRLTVSCDVPQRDINLRLSYNEIPPEGAGLTIQQRLDGMRTLFEQQGCTIVSCVSDGHGDVPGYRMLIEKDHGKDRLLIRVIKAGCSSPRCPLHGSSVPPRHRATQWVFPPIGAVLVAVRLVQYSSNREAQHLDAPVETLQC